MMSSLIDYIIAHPGPVLGLIGILITNIVSFYLNTKSMKMAAAIQNQLTSYKDVIERRNRTIEAAYSRAEQNANITANRQIAAAENAWKRILSIRKLCQPYIDIDTFIKRGDRSTKMLEQHGCSSTNESYQLFYDLASNDPLEIDRPYLGEDFWATYLAYRSVACRTLFYYSACRNSEIEVVWRDDECFRSILNAVLDNETIDRLYSKDTAFLVNAMNRLQTIACNKLSHILTGKEASINSIKLTTELESLMGKADWSGDKEESGSSQC